MLDFVSGDIWNSIWSALYYVYLWMPLWLPITFFILVFKAWLYFRRSAYWQDMGTVVLEIKLPKEIFKSPIAMEVILGALHQTADESGWYFQYWKGQTRSWFSLEIASIEGKIHFYIWARKKYKTSIENHIYSQYPGAEVYEVEDYTKPFYYDSNLHNLWACEWKLTQPDPFPIKTYVDYGLEKDPKEEFKVDPMVSMLEFMGSATAGHNVFFQILIRAHVKDKRKPGTLFEKTDAWQDEAKEEIKKVIEGFKPEDKEKFGRMPTKGEIDSIATLERSTSKYPFDVGIRCIYLADKDKYNPAFIGGIIGSFKQFGSPGSNGFKPDGWISYFDRPWKKWAGKEEGLKSKVIEEYKLRRYFFSPWRGKYFYSKPFVLNVEELATIYHFPGATATTPTFERVPSRKSEAPANLPL